MIGKYVYVGMPRHLYSYEAVCDLIRRFWGYGMCVSKVYDDEARGDKWLIYDMSCVFKRDKETGKSRSFGIVIEPRYAPTNDRWAHKIREYEHLPKKYVELLRFHFDYWGE